jgi:hypothetical protein
MMVINIFLHENIIDKKAGAAFNLLLQESGVRAR